MINIDKPLAICYNDRLHTTKKECSVTLSPGLSGVFVGCRCKNTNDEEIFIFDIRDGKCVAFFNSKNGFIWSYEIDKYTLTNTNVILDSAIDLLKNLIDNTPDEQEEEIAILRNAQCYIEEQKELCE